MGYRDDTLALKSQITSQAQENSKIQQQLHQLGEDGESLVQQLKKVRWRHRLLRLAGWATRNPLTLLLLLLITLLAGYLSIGPALKEARRERAHRTRVAALGQGCTNRLFIDASESGAQAWLVNLRLGTVPLQLPICPGTYHILVTYPAASVWDRIVMIKGKEDQRVYARLYGDNVQGDGMMVHSVPEGALLFVNGQEISRTPVVLDSSLVEGGKVSLSLWAGGYKPVHIDVPVSPEIYVQLGQPLAEVSP